MPLIGADFFHRRKQREQRFEKSPSLTKFASVGFPPKNTRRKPLPWQNRIHGRPQKDFPTGAAHGELKDGNGLH
jgi:hypothetical protein